MRWQMLLLLVVWQLLRLLLLLLLLLLPHTHERRLNLPIGPVLRSKPTTIIPQSTHPSHAKQLRLSWAPQVHVARMT
jgi:hypothetical protein